MPGIKSVLFGDSCAYGAAPTPSGRHAVTPVMTLNANQSTFDFAYDHSHGGASFAQFFSPLQAVREGAGLPNGMTFADFLLNTDAGAILFSMGGLDRNDLTALAAHVKQAATLCQFASKHFAFVGVPEINATFSFAYDSLGATDFYASENLSVVASVAAANEILRQTCIHQGYPFIDVRALVPQADWSDITCDIIHPSQDYSTAIFTRVATSIG